MSYYIVFHSSKESQTKWLTIAPQSIHNVNVKMASNIHIIDIMYGIQYILYNQLDQTEGVIYKQTKYPKRSFTLHEISLYP